MGREASVQVRCSLTVCLVLFVWPHGGVDRLSSVLRTSALCHEVAWKKKIGRGLLLCATRWRKKKNGRGPIEQCVEKFCLVPRGGVKGKKNISFEDRLCNEFWIFLFALCYEVAEEWKATRKPLTLTIYVDLVLKRKELSWAKQWLCA